MLDNFNYTGLVRITINNKTFIIHNEGLDSLFKLIAKALAGYNISDEKPSNLIIKDSSDKNVLTVSSLDLFASSYVQLESDFDTENYQYAGNWAARYLCYLPQYLLKIGMTPSKFILSNGNNLAQVNISETISDLITSLQPGSQALIEWNLLVDNYPHISASTEDDNNDNNSNLNTPE